MLKYWKPSKFQVIVTKNADLSNEALFWKFLVLFLEELKPFVLALKWNL